MSSNIDKIKPNFFYSVRPKPYIPPSFVGQKSEQTNSDESEAKEEYYRAEVYLKEGGQNYNLMGWSKEQIITDLLDQYEKHIHFLNVIR
ncbi:MAG: hypothetical protein GX248_03740 [Peptococcaceae bacterium]|nr:hypothetical protein [Peptococcaceae bacterium]